MSKVYCLFPGVAREGLELKNRYYCCHKQRKIKERYTNTVSAWFNLLGDRLEHANTSGQVTETFRKKITKTKSPSQSPRSTTAFTFIISKKR